MAHMKAHMVEAQTTGQGANAALEPIPVEAAGRRDHVDGVAGTECLHAPTLP